MCFANGFRIFCVAGVHAGKNVERRPSLGTVVVVRPSCTNICFWYVPQKLRPFDPCQEGGPKRTALHRVAPYIKARMQKEGCAMIGFQIDATVRNGHDVNFFRMVFASCDTVAESDVDETMADIARIGEEMAIKEEEEQVLVNTRERDMN